MKITERIDEMEKMISEQSGQLAVTLPEHSAKELIRYCREHAELKKKYNQLQAKANYYQEVYASTKAEMKRREKEYGDSREKQTAGNPRRNRHSAKA